MLRISMPKGPVLMVHAVLNIHFSPVRMGLPPGFRSGLPSAGGGGTLVARASVSQIYFGMVGASESCELIAYYYYYYYIHMYFVALFLFSQLGRQMLDELLCTWCITHICSNLSFNVFHPISPFSSFFLSFLYLLLSLKNKKSH